MATGGPQLKTNRHPKGRSLAEGMLWFGGSYVVSVLGYLVVNAIAARLLGSKGFGQFVIIYTAGLAIVQLGMLGVHRAGLREAARIDSADDPMLAQLRSGVRAVILVTLPLCGVIAGLLSWLMLSGEPVEKSVTALAVAGLVVGSGHQRVLANYLRGFGYIRFASLLQGGSGGALVVVVQATLMLLGATLLPGLGLAGILSAMTLGYVLPIAVAWPIVSKHWIHTSISRRNFRNVRVVIARDWKFLVVQLASNINQYLELWIAGIVLVTIDASLFGAAQRLAVLIAFPLTALQIVLSPTISRLWALKRPADLEAVLRTAAWVALVISTVALLPLVLAPGQILLRVFGPEFQSASIVLVLLSIGYFVNALSGLCGPTLSMSHNEGRSAAIVSTSLFARLLGGTLSAAALGLIGLSISAAVITAATSLALWISTKRLVGVETLPALRPQLSLLWRTKG